jgi:hypothetical protein
MTVHPNALGTPTSSLNRLTDGRRYPRIKDSPAAVLESCKGYSGAGWQRSRAAWPGSPVGDLVFDLGQLYPSQSSRTRTLASSAFRGCSFLL